MRLVTKVMAALMLVTASGDIALAQYNCGFLTIEQCRAYLTGGSSFCVPNQFYNPHGPAKRTRKNSGNFIKTSHLRREWPLALSAF